MTKQTFLQGALILIIAGIITRFLGFINRIVTARLMGEEGIGLYMMAMPTLLLVMALTQMGLPVAIAKRVSEADAVGDTHKIKKIIVVSLTITSILSVIFTIGMIIAAPFIATYLLTDERTLYPILAITPIVPIIAISSVIRGYFQGKQNMKPQSFALVIEQVVRISCVAIFVNLLLPYGVEFAAAGAMISVILGEFASLLFMVSRFKKNKIENIRPKFFSYLKSSKQTVKELFSISIPSTGDRLIGSVTNFLEPILVAQSLRVAGMTNSQATKQYGELTGYAIPLLLLPTFITHSLSVALVPSIAEAEAMNNKRMVHHRIHQSIRISFASGAISTVVLTLFAMPILTYMYDSANASNFIVLMAPFYILLYIQGPLQSALQALDLAKQAMWNSLIGAGCKLVLMILLASHPDIGIMGVAIAMSVGVVLVTLLHLASLQKAIQYHIPFKDLCKMILLLLLTFGAGNLLKVWYEQVTDHLLIFILLLIILSVIYIGLLFLLRFITKDELKQIPFLRRFF